MTRELSRRFRWLAGPAVAVVSLVLVLGIGEVIARIVSWSRPAPAPLEIPAEWQDLPRIEGLFATAAPNVRGLNRGALFETNSAGIRGPERELEKDPGVFRIVITGDSIAIGVGVVYEETYAGRLQDTPMIDTALRDREVEVLDIGLPGHNTRWAADRVERLGLPYDPDLVIYGYTVNDVEGPDYEDLRSERIANPLFYHDSPSYLLRTLWPRWTSIHELISWLPGSYRYELDQNYFHNPKAWLQVENGLDHLARMGRDNDFCVVVLIHTALTSLGPLHPFERHYEWIADAARRRHFQVVETLPYFQGMDGPSLWILPNDPHPNGRGHEILFEALMDGLREVPDSCWSEEGSGDRRGMTTSAARTHG